MITYRILLLTLVLPFCCFSCSKSEEPAYSGDGKRPVYIELSQLQNIRNLKPQMIESSGPIFLRDTLFFMIEMRKGIHVFSVADLTNPQPLTFIQVPAITDFTISGDRLYCDSWRDMLTIDISDINNVKELSRLSGVFSPSLFPPFYSGIFECVDESRGAVIDWIDDTLINAKCITGF